MSTPSPIVIVGGGISGLATAFYLNRALADRADRPAIHLFEASERFGGPVGTEVVDGFLLERGPDSFLGTPPHVVQLAEDLGLADDLITPAHCTPALLVWARGKLRAMPDGTRLVVPGKIRAFLESDLLTPAGKARVMMEPLIPAGDLERDQSIGAFFRRRMGDELVDTLIAPILAGIYSGDIDTLSLDATFPRFFEQVREHGSLIRAALAMPTPSGGTPKSPFRSLRHGVGSLIDGLLAELEAAAHVTIHTDAPVFGITPRAHGGWTVRVDGGASTADLLDETGHIDASAVVLSVPSFVTGKLLGPLVSGAAADFSTTPYTSTVGVYLGLPPGDQAARVPTSAGVLFPRGPEWRIKGVQLGANKYPGRAPEGGALLRIFMGGVGATHLVERSDDDLIAIARREVSEALRFPLEPVLTRVMRYRRRAPQYIVGHRARMDRALKQVPAGVAVVGAGYRGIGLPACIESAKAAVDTALAAL